MEEINDADQKIINEILCLHSDDHLLIFFDKFGSEIATFCAETATKMQVPFCALFFPIFTQKQYSRTMFLPGNLIKCLQESQAIIFAVSDDDGCTKFREMALNYAKEGKEKILHLPGLEYKQFLRELKELDIAKLNEEGFPLRESIQNCSSLNIITKCKKGGNDENYELRITLEPGRRIHQDIGSPLPGEIAQLPAGEIYFAPKEFVANGNIVINGSAPQRVFRNDDLIILNFKDGYVDINNSFFSNTLYGKRFREELLETKNRNKLNIALGEFGIGINRRIVDLNGKPIHDEKAYGTAHIALGENKPFDGLIDCDSHIDLIFIPLRIDIEGKPIPLKWGLKNRK